ELRAQERGLTSFPVTPFSAGGDVDLGGFREHVRYLIAAHPAALFVCGGTGEFFSLTPDEYRALVRAAVEEARGDLPAVARGHEGGAMKIAAMRVVPVAMAAPPLRSAFGLHPPYALRTIVQLRTD